MRTTIRRIAATGFSVASLLLVSSAAYAGSAQNINFESPTYSVGNIDGQNGWSKTGPYDANVTANTTTNGILGGQSLRISDAVTSGSFGDQTFAPLLADAAGEADSTDGTFSPGDLQRHFEMRFNFATTVLNAQQLGMHMSVSPDRGDGSRMSYLRFEDNSGGIDVFFDDVIGTGNPANFHETKIATLSRSKVHKVRLTLDVFDGPSNDVVKVWIDGQLKITGTSWENYYRYDSESAFEQSPRIVKTVLFRESGTAHPLNLGKGFLVDNLRYHTAQSTSEDKAKGDLTMSGPSQRIKFDIGGNKQPDTVEYWNFDYPGGLHYQADVTCSNINTLAKEARFMFQIPPGYPGLSGTYVVAYVKDQKHGADLYGHQATTDLNTATQWCQGGSDAGYSPTMYPVTSGQVKVTPSS